MASLKAEKLHPFMPAEDDKFPGFALKKAWKWVEARNYFSITTSARPSAHVPTMGPPRSI